MDGLPGLQRGVKTAITDDVKPVKKMVGPYAPLKGPRRPNQVFTVGHLILVALLSAFSTVVLIFVALKFGFERFDLERGIWR